MTQKELDQKLERLGFLLKDQRQNLFISILKASTQTGLNRHTIANIENGKGQIASFIIYAEFLDYELSLKKKEL